MLLADAMSLPVVTSVTDCADFGTTVAPFVGQLQALPLLVWQHITDLQALKSVYLSTNPLMSGFALSVALAPIFLVSSEINRNYSQVDRVWSLLPTVYTAHYALWAHMSGLPTQRVDNVLAFSCVWSLRLTFNYWRKGGYEIGSEDYRWEILKAKLSPPLMFIFNVVFISLSQSVLLWSITTPTYVLLLASKATGQDMTTEDIVFACVLMGLILVTFFADQQQWNFQKAKKQYQETAKVPHKYEREDLDRGFVVTGLWSWSRHPNFAAEQAIWVVLYQWCCFETYTYYNWTFIGALSYLFLFQGSTWFTESISAGKYPEYKEYQQRVGKFLPNITGGGMPHAKAPASEEKKTK